MPPHDNALDNPAEVDGEIRMTFTPFGVVALWAARHGLEVGADEISELLACFGLSPEDQNRTLPVKKP